MLTPAHEREYLKLAAVWLACRLRAMGGDVDQFQRGARVRYLHGFRADRLCGMLLRRSTFRRTGDWVVLWDNSKMLTAFERDMEVIDSQITPKGDLSWSLLGCRDYAAEMSLMLAEARACSVRDV